MNRSPARALLLSGLLCAAAAAAATLPLPAPDPERGLIGITVRSLAPVRAIRSHAVQVYFVRLEEGVDPLAAEEVIPSNHRDGKQLFLLNAKPGRYVAVAAELKPAPMSGGLDLKAFFSSALIPKTEVTVAPGEVAFAGDYLVAQHMDMKNADAAQGHYYQLLAPDTAQRTYFARTMGGEAVYRAELETMSREPAVEREFWRQAAAGELRKKAGWRELIEKRLAALPQP